MQFELLKKEKVFKDPLYGYVRINYKIISDLIDTTEVQRLRRITQLSGVKMVFHTAEHSRFTHSLGAYEMSRIVLENALGLKDKLTQYEQVLFLVSALLHDIGHGPYSHSFEHVLNFNHETMTAKLILTNTQVNKVLSQYEKMDQDVAGIILKKGKFPLIESLVSSQLDVDRLDYLSRDAYFTGASYGIIDYLRIIRGMRIVDNQIVFCQSAVHAIESYIMSRYHMYWQVYYHPKARACELILQSIYLRIKDLHSAGQKIDVQITSLLNLFESLDDIESYIDIDDAYINGMLKQMTKSNDEILRNLSNDFFNRRLYKFIEISEDKMKKLTSTITKYDFYLESISQVAYLQATNKKLDIDIKILTTDDKIVSLEDFSQVIKGLISAPTKISYRLFHKYDYQF